MPSGARCTRVPRGGVAGAVALALAAALLLPGCADKEDESAAYLQACHGAPLKTAARRNRAMEEGYAIVGRYDCIDKASHAAMQERKIRRELANTPQALEARQQALAAQRMRDDAAPAERALVASTASARPSAPVCGVGIDANTASESRLSRLHAVGPDAAAQIVHERAKQRFADWPDLVNRVIALHAAQPAVRASICGLTVNGKSLPGARPGAVFP